jgi:hypothetical protein
MLEPWRLQEHHYVASAARRPGCCAARVAGVERCSSLAPGRILEAASAVAVELSEGRRAVVDAEGYRSDRIGHRFDSTRPVVRTQPGGIRPGSPETKRQKMRLPAEVLALREGPQVLRIAVRRVS